MTVRCNVDSSYNKHKEGRLKRRKVDAADRNLIMYEFQNHIKIMSIFSLIHPRVDKHSKLDRQSVRDYKPPTKLTTMILKPIVVVLHSFITLVYIKNSL